jgi:hypothetical protein
MTAVLHVDLCGAGLLGPGLADWSSGQALLKDPSAWTSSPTVLPAPARLPPAERRRAGAIVKVSLAVADQACTQAGIDTHDLATVFSASTGDAANCHALCEALAAPERIVSPTRFTNSVHNASAGYWHIATTSRAPSTSLCAHDASFGAGLLEAASQCLSWQRPVLLVAADVPYPEPLRSARPLPDAFGIALLIAPRGSRPALAALSLQLGDETPTPCSDEALDGLRHAIPAARGLPLLQSLTLGGPSSLVIEYLPGLALKAELGR